MRLLIADKVPEVWVPPVHVRELRALISYCWRLVKMSIMTQNRLHSLLHRHNIHPPEGGLDPGPTSTASARDSSPRRRPTRQEFPKRVRKIGIPISSLSLCEEFLGCLELPLVQRPARLPPFIEMLRLIK